MAAATAMAANMMLPEWALTEKSLPNKSGLLGKNFDFDIFFEVILLYKM
jgi:hypothetical protein